MRMLSCDELTQVAKENASALHRDFYAGDLSMSLMQRKTYPGGKWIVEDNVRYLPCYYVQSVPLFDADVADFNDERMFWNMVMGRLATGLKRLRSHIKRSMFRELGSLVFPEFDDNDEFMLELYPMAVTNDPDKVRQIVSFEEVMWCETFESIANFDKSFFDRLPHRTDKLEPTVFTPRLWKEHLEGITPIGYYNTEPPDAPYDKKYGITSPAVWKSILDYYAREEGWSGRIDEDLKQQGYDNIVIEDVPIIAEKEMFVPDEKSHQIYTLDYQWLTLRPHQLFDVKLTNFQRTPSAVGAYTIFVWFGNMSFQSLDSLGLMLGLDPALRWS